MSIALQSPPYRPVAFPVCVLAAVSLFFSGAAFGQDKLVLSPGASASTLAGSGRDAALVAGAAGSVSLGAPAGLAYDGAGNLYIADTRNHRIARVNGAGELTVAAGSGRQGFTGDGGPADAAELNAPAAVVADRAGDLWIADTANHCVRRVDAASGTIRTIAGTGNAGSSGDGSAATKAQLRSPAALALSPDGSIFIADTGNHRIRKLLADGSLTAVAGDGSEGDLGDGGKANAASFLQPTGLAVLPDGTLLVADRAARRVRAVTTDGLIGPYAPTAALTLRRPGAIAMDASGSVFIADAANQQVLQAAQGGTASFAGSGVQGRFTPGSPLLTAIDDPAMLAAATDGSVAISDRHNHQVQKVAASALAFGDVAVGNTSKPQPLTLRNAGQDALQVVALDLPAGFARLPSESTCQPAPFPLASGASCSIALVFSPVAQGAASAVARVEPAHGAPQAVLLSGNGTAAGARAASQTTLRSDGAISYTGAPIALTATVAGSLLNAPSGSVTFLDDGTPLATSAVRSGAASASFPSLPAGQHPIRATYSGDATYSGSTSLPLTLTVAPQPDFALAAGASSFSGRAGGAVSIPFSVTPSNGTLNRAVQFAVSGLPAGASATFAPPVLTLGGDTATVTLTVTLPTVVASRRGTPVSLPSTLAWVGFLGFAARRRRRWQVVSTSQALAGAALLCLCGCGSGFRAGMSSTTDAGTTRTYSAVVTATTAGVLGTPLTHTMAVGLVVTQ